MNEWLFWTQMLMNGTEVEQQVAMAAMDAWFIEDQRRNILGEPEEDEND